MNRNTKISLKCLLKSVLSQNDGYVSLFSEIIHEAKDYYPYFYVKIDNGKNMVASYKNQQLVIGIQELSNIWEIVGEYCSAINIFIHEAECNNKEEIDTLFQKICWESGSKNEDTDKESLPLLCVKIKNSDIQCKHVFLWAFAFSLFHEFGHLRKHHERSNTKNECEADEFAWEMISKSIPPKDYTDIEVGAMMSTFSMFDNNVKISDHPHPLTRLLFLLQKTKRDDKHLYWEISYDFLKNWVKTLSNNIDWEREKYETPKEAIFKLANTLQIDTDFNE